VQCVCAEYVDHKIWIGRKTADLFWSLLLFGYYHLFYSIPNKMKAKSTSPASLFSSHYHHQQQRFLEIFRSVRNQKLLYGSVILTLAWFVWMVQAFHVPVALIDDDDVTSTSTTTLVTSFGSNDGVWYCDASRLTNQSVVYSFGLGKDTSFDETLLRTFPGLRIWGFDPTPQAVQYVNERMNAQHLDPDYFTFVPEALTGDPTTDSLSFVVPYRPKISEHSGTGLKPWRTTVSYPAATLQSFMERFGHERLDVLKMDVEGSEYQVLEDMIRHDFFPVQQLLLEFHLRFFWSNPFMRLQHKRIFKALKEQGFRLAHSDDLQREMTFVR
jgi:FkbM family methyltransferase